MAPAMSPSRPPKASPKAFSPRFPQTIPPLPPGTAKPSSAPVLSVRDGLALVQLSGICTVAYTGGAPTLGYDMLAADASGGIKTTEAGGRTVLVTAVDSTAMTAEILL